MIIADYVIAKAACCPIHLVHKHLWCSPSGRGNRGWFQFL